MPEPAHEKPGGGGGGGGGSALLESREPLTYTEWQQEARSRWEKRGSYKARVGRKGRTLAELLGETASARERVVIEAIAAFDPNWEPGRHFRASRLSFGSTMRSGPRPWPRERVQEGEGDGGVMCGK